MKNGETKKKACRDNKIEQTTGQCDQMEAITSKMNQVLKRRKEGRNENEEEEWKTT